MQVKTFPPGLRVGEHITRTVTYCIVGEDGEILYTPSKFTGTKPEVYDRRHAAYTALHEMESKDAPTE